MRARERTALALLAIGIASVMLSQPSLTGAAIGYSSPSPSYFLPVGVISFIFSVVILFSESLEDKVSFASAHEEELYKRRLKMIESTTDEYYESLLASLERHEGLTPSGNQDLIPRVNEKLHRLVPKNVRSHINRIGHLQHFTYEDLRELALLEAPNHPDPEKRKEFQYRFGKALEATDNFVGLAASRYVNSFLANLSAIHDNLYHAIAEHYGIAGGRSKRELNAEIEKKNPALAKLLRDELYASEQAKLLTGLRNSALHSKTAMEVRASPFGVHREPSPDAAVHDDGTYVSVPGSRGLFVTSGEPGAQAYHLFELLAGFYRHYNQTAAKALDSMLNPGKESDRKE